MSLSNIRHWAPILYAVEIPLNVLRIIWMVLNGNINRQFAVFDVHGGANLAPIIAARILHIPVVWHLHETLPRFRQLVRWGRRVLKHLPHKIIAVADAAKETFSVHDALTIPAPVDAAYWSRAVLDGHETGVAEWCYGNKDRPPFRILAVANLNPLKGIDILLAALRELEGPWHLKIVGAELETHSAYARFLYEQANQLASLGSGAIEFLGWTEREKIRALMSACDVFVLPSRSEACPIALLEALSMECATVATDVGAVRQMIPSSIAAECIVKSEDPHGLCRALAAVRGKSVANRQLASRLSREKIINSYALDQISALTLTVYRDLTKDLIPQ
jgi:glycosyltransferase involved in cell wall biosynthesis